MRRPARTAVAETECPADGKSVATGASLSVAHFDHRRCRP